MVSELSATTRAGKWTKTRLDRMSFSQRQGTVVAILGPSGAGKSSLFSALLGELQADGGGIYFGGLDLATHGEQIRSTIGFVPQDDSLHRTLTVETLLRYSDRLRSPQRRSDRQRRIDQVCEALKLEAQHREKQVESSPGASESACPSRWRSWPNRGC